VARNKRTPKERRAFRDWFRRWHGGFDYGSPLAARCHTRCVETEYGTFMECDPDPPTREEWLASLTPEMRRLFLQDEAYSEARRRRNDSLRGRPRGRPRK
jgi:hypothetical protein